MFNDNKLQGVAAIDITIGYIDEVLTLKKNDYYAYSFLIDNLGRTLYHHLLPKPSTSESTSRVIVDIATLEHEASRAGVISSMKRWVYQ